MTSKNINHIQYFFIYEDKYLQSCEDDVFWLNSCILCSFVILLQGTTKQLSNENKRKSKLYQHKKHAANQACGYLEAVLGSSCNTFLHPWCKNLNIKWNKKGITCTYWAVTAPTNHWLPCWRGRAIWQQSSTLSWSKVRSLPHSGGSRGRTR